MPRTLTIDEILGGVGFGQPQTVGNMSVLPIIDEDGSAQDDDWAPPDVNVGTSHYGTVDLENRSEEQPTIVPTGAGWVTSQRAQDHAVPSAVLIGPNKKLKVEFAACIEESQGGYITKGAHEMLILPASMRPSALASRTRREYSKLWNDIKILNDATGVDQHGGHLVYFLKQFERQLDEFVAEFELVPNQIGAVVFIGKRVAGVERAPTYAYWQRIWVPLIRVCYGSLAIMHAKKWKGRYGHRLPLESTAKTLEGLMQSLQDLRSKEVNVLNEMFVDAAKMQLQCADPDQRLGSAELRTFAGEKMCGQLVSGQKNIKYPYLSCSCTS